KCPFLHRHTWRPTCLARWHMVHHQWKNCRTNGCELSADGRRYRRLNRHNSKLGNCSTRLHTHCSCHYECQTPAPTLWLSTETTLGGVSISVPRMRACRLGRQHLQRLSLANKYCAPIC